MIEPGRRMTDGQQRLQANGAVLGQKGLTRSDQLGRVVQLGADVVDVERVAAPEEELGVARGDQRPKRRTVLE